MAKIKNPLKGRARGLPLRIIMLLVSLGAGMLYSIIYAEKVRKDPSKSLVYDQYE